MATRYVFDRIQFGPMKRGELASGWNIIVEFLGRSGVPNKAVTLAEAMEDPELREVLQSPDINKGGTIPLEMIQKLAKIKDVASTYAKEPDPFKQAQIKKIKEEQAARWARYGTPEQRLMRYRSEEKQEQTSSKMPYVIAGIVGVGILAYFLSRKSAAPVSPPRPMSEPIES